MNDAIRTPTRMEIVERVSRLGPLFAKRTAEYDREARFPHENWEDLRDAGLLGIAVPVEAGGLGGDFVAYALASEELGRHCAATALTFNMHVATTLLVGEIADALDLTAAERTLLVERRARLWDGIVTEHHIHSQPFSEGRAAGATGGYATRATPVEGGFRVTGRKIFASLAGASDYHNILCQTEGDPRVRLLGVPHDADGLMIEGEWDPLGMRATDSRNLVMDDVFVPAENEWLPPGAFDQAATRWPYFFMTLSFTYLGLMRAIRDFTAEYLRQSGRASNPVKQQGWAEMNLVYEQAQALCYRILGDVCVDPEPAKVHRAWASLVTTMEGAPTMAATAIRICGGRSMLRPSLIEQAYRDARCGAAMLPWSVEVCLERLGAAGIGGPPEEARR